MRTATLAAAHVLQVGADSLGESVVPLDVLHIDKKKSWWKVRDIHGEDPCIEAPPACA